MNIADYKGVWVFAEQRDGHLQKVALELLGKGREIADKIGVELTAILLGDNIDEIAKDKNKRMIVNHIFTLATYKSHKDIYGMKGTQLDLDLVLKGQTLSSGSMNEGDTMNYLENFSFVNYLTEEYGLEKILYLNVADFNQLTYEEVFGKSFKKLKIDWMNYFKENIKDIELIL